MGKATGPLYKVHFRRRRQGVTDFSKRIALLKSGKPRLVVRKTNKYVLVQVVQLSEKGDQTVTSATSKQLSKYGFAGKANTPSAYLTGLLVARAAVKKGVKECVADFGRHAAIKGSLLYAALKGALEGGLKIPVGGEVFPSQERMEGKHLKSPAGFKEATQKIMSL